MDNVFDVPFFRVWKCKLIICQPRRKKRTKRDLITQPSRNNPNNTAAHQSMASQGQCAEHEVSEKERVRPKGQRVEDKVARKDRKNPETSTRTTYLHDHAFEATQRMLCNQDPPCSTLWLSFLAFPFCFSGQQLSVNLQQKKATTSFKIQIKPKQADNSHIW